MKRKIRITGIFTGFAALFMGLQVYGQALSLSYSPSSQTYSAGTFVGTVSPSVSGGPASGGGQTTSSFVSSGLYNPLNTAVDVSGNVYIADSDNNQIKKVTPSGTVTVLAGSGSAGSSDGMGSGASFQHPSALAVDASGNVFVSDQQNHKIRKITPTGAVTTFAGSGSPGFANGTGTGASFSSPIGLAFDSSGNLYVADYSNNRIRVISPSGQVGTFAGTGAAGADNGNALSATFRNPMGVAVDASGNVYVADRLNHMVRKISAGNVSTVAGNGTAGYAVGYGTSARFQYPNNLAIDASGNIYVADQQNHMVRKIDASGYVSAFVGSTSAGTVNGTGGGVRLNSPYGLSIDKQGTLYVAETGSSSIRKIVTSAFVIAPQLPAGLSFNNSNGNITGTPAVASPATNYYITAYNTTHSSGAFALNITVTGGSLSGVQPSYERNFVMETAIRESGVTAMSQLGGLSVAQANRNINYFDGLGRPLQTVLVQASPSGKDIVQPMDYDAYGREAVAYLPYAARTESNGGYKADAITQQQNYYTASNGSTTGWDPGVVKTPSPYSVTVFEASPLNRVLEQGAPGSVWQPGTRTTTSGRSVLAGYGTNNSSTAYSTTGFAVRRYSATAVTVAGQEHERVLGVSGYYGAGQLYLSISKDENWLPSDGKVGTTEEYNDKQGQVVLKRVFNLGASAVQVLSTYYVYDDLGNLSFVLTAGASPDGTALPDQGELDLVCYQYRYDGRRRLIEKKLPGKGWEEVIYNPLDQVVFTQDAVQRGGAVRSFIKYDALGRTVMTGIEIGHHGTRAEVQGTVNTLVPYWETRDNTVVNYHGYNNLSCPSFVPNLQPHVVNYYDDYNIPGIPDNQSGSYSNKTKGLLTASKTLVLGTGNYLWTVNYYDEEGRIARSWQQHYKGGVTAANSYDQTSFTYNFAGEIVSSTRKHYVAGVQKLYVYNEYTYDHMGRKISTRQRTGDSDATANPLVYLSKSSYNETGQQLEKALHSTNNGASFAQTVRYRYNPRGWLSSQAAPLFTQELKYELDSTGLVAQYNGNISQQKWGTATLVNKKYTYTYDRMNRLLSALSNDGNDETIAYSGMGNITSLQRKSLTAVVDQLNYSYTGHRLNGVGDANANALASFQLPGSTAYTYDVNGNMKSRINTVNLGNNLKTITYNWLNLPESMNANGALITYTYDANGNKLKKLVSGTVNLNNEYISGIQYEDGDLKYVATETGRARRISATSYSYEHTLTDHLGNGRVYFDMSGGAVRTIQETDYYAFGLDIQRNLVGVENKFQYNGKEKQDQEKMYDYGARFYDPVIGRWSVIDPKAELYFSHSPFNYTAGNPIVLIDPNGMEIKPIKDGFEFTENDAISAYQVLSGKKENVFVDIRRNAVDVESENTAPAGYYGEWAVFAAQNLKLASEALSFIGRKSIKNLVLATHGGQSEGTSKIRTDDLDQEIRANNTPDHFITTDDMINGTNLGSLRALKAIAGKVTDDGNFILAACFVGNGQQGKDFSKALRKLTNGRLNIYMPKDFIHVPSAALPAHGKILGMTLPNFFNVDGSAGWLKTSSGTGRFSNVSSISVSMYKNKLPIRIIK
jgi:RHS repeat-associated protein